MKLIQLVVLKRAANTGKGGDVPFSDCGDAARRAAFIGPRESLIGIGLGIEKGVRSNLQESFVLERKQGDASCDFDIVVARC